MNPTTYSMTASISLIFILVVVWMVMIHRTFIHQSKTLHKLISIFPIFKILYWLFEVIILYTCPWRSNSIEKARPYLSMLAVSLNTIYMTFLVAIIFVMSVGYTVVRTELSKDSINSMIFNMGAIYILDSIYFISTD